MNKLVLITNPGSASRKYALYSLSNNLDPSDKDGDNSDAVALYQLHFETKGAKVVVTITDSDGKKSEQNTDLESLNDAISYVADFAKSNLDQSLDAVIVRIVAPGDYFTKNHIVDEEYMRELKKAEKRNPVHVPTTANEIRGVKESFKDIKIISVSDSAFHWEKPDYTKYYSFSTSVADEAEIKRYGYHGLSYAFISRYMRSQGILPKKLIACHLGSGSSVSAIKNGKALDNSMGYTPLEGVAMSTRVGTIDAAAALALKQAKGIASDEELLIYLNKKCGLYGLSNVSDDMRNIIAKATEGDERSALTLKIFYYRIKAYIGQMAADLNGADALVFAGTIGERGAETRTAIAKDLGYLGFELDEKKNDNPVFEQDGAPVRYALISTKSSKPIYIVKTDETAEMLAQAKKLL